MKDGELYMVEYGSVIKISFTMPDHDVDITMDCHYAPAPYIAEDTSSEVRDGQPRVRIYTDVDSRYILEDMIAKLELFCE